MKFVKLVLLAALGMTASVAMAGSDSSVDRLGRGSQIHGGSVLVNGTAADVFRANGRSTPAQSMAARIIQPVNAAERSVDSVQGRA
jgi:hypothetical protein